MNRPSFFTQGADRTGPWLVTCDHASNAVPDHVNGGTLGLPETEMARHIAYDLGARGVSEALGKLLDSPVIGAEFSRLVIDPNRGLDDPTLLMRVYDGTIIPGNRHADAEERQRRIDTCWQPYHDALADMAARPGTIYLAIHSFTPRLNGRHPRPWEIGVLHADDDRISRPLIARLSAALDTPVGDNEPYAGHLPGDAVDQHGLQHGRPNVLIELRHDLIRTPQDQHKWAAFLAPHLEAARRDADL